MSRLHICNTFFERELETQSKKPLPHWIHSHPVLLQLQFLPLLYAGPDDRIAVTELPENPDPRLCLLEDAPRLPIEHWGPSQTIATWAQSKGIPYAIPDWELVKKINSKVFSFTESPPLPGAKLLHSEEEVREWIETTPGDQILKTPFGTAGRGHLFPKGKKEIVFRGVNMPLIAEPWVERVIDFSTQWNKGQLIEVTVFENEANGTYRGTYAGKVESWALQEHLAVAKPLVEKIAAMGYSDHLGVDSFIYLWEGKKRVHPVVEINARKTMSWVALQTPGLSIYYTKGKEGLLPKQLGQVFFKRNLTYAKCSV